MRKDKACKLIDIGKYFLLRINFERETKQIKEIILHHCVSYFIVEI